MTWIYFKRRARDAGGKSEIVIYPEAPQGFHADHRPGPAADGWKKMQARFKQHGV